MADKAKGPADLWYNLSLGESKEFEGLRVRRVPYGWLVYEFNGTVNLPPVFVPNYAELPSLVVSEQR